LLLLFSQSLCIEGILMQSAQSIKIEISDSNNHYPKCVSSFA
jgi:hypothetical protein